MKPSACMFLAVVVLLLAGLFGGFALKNDTLVVMSAGALIGVLLMVTVVIQAADEEAANAERNRQEDPLPKLPQGGSGTAPPQRSQAIASLRAAKARRAQQTALRLEEFD